MGHNSIPSLIITFPDLVWALQTNISNILIVESPGLGSIQFRNWNCSSIPIPIPELELELKLVELKMELELKYLELELELELKTGIEFFSIATAALTSQPTISKF